MEPPVIGAWVPHKGDSMERTGNHMKLRRYPGADEATSVFQIFLEKQIERANGYECGGQSG